MYTDFARVYDPLMADVDYDGWCDYYAELLQTQGIYGGRLCECACGTGSLTVRLSRKGFDVTGVDLSREMLSVAAEKAGKWGCAIPFVQQDMCSLHLHRMQDAVLATCDGVNYLLTLQRLRQFMMSASKALRPGGVLAFDVSTPCKLREQLGDHVLTDSGPDIAYIWQNRYSAASATVQMDISFFVHTGNGVYSRLEETQKQRAWSREELRGALREAGFDRIRLYGGRTLNGARERDTRWHICARKKKENP